MANAYSATYRGIVGDGTMTESESTEMEIKCTFLVLAACIVAVFLTRAVNGYVISNLEDNYKQSNFDRALSESDGNRLKTEELLDAELRKIKVGIGQ
jgi:hypothetical protein